MPTALITGASRGLGRALATGLASRGWRMVLDARGADDLLAVADELGDAVIPVPGDVTDAAHRRALADTTAAAGGLDLLVHNASTLGASPRPRLDDTSDEVLRNTFDVNAVAPVLLTQLVPFRRDATILAVTSDAAVEPYAGWGPYGASKAALEHLFAIYAAERPDLRVLVVDPGDLRTQMQQDAFPGEDISDRTAPEDVVPTLLRLIEGEQTSGRYRASDVTVEVAG